MPAALLMLTLGGILVYSALTGTSIIDVISGKQTDHLDAQGGSLNIGNNDPTSNSVSSGSGLAAISSSIFPGVGTFDGKPVAKWIIPILTYARKQGWTGTVTSGYRSAADQARVCATGVKPCAAPGTSNHQGTVFPSGAVDVTQAGQLSSILLRSPYATELVWAGSKDPVHFSHPHNGSY